MSQMCVNLIYYLNNAMTTGKRPTNRIEEEPWLNLACFLMREKLTKENFTDVT